MNLEAEKLKLVKMILDIDSETTINKLKAFIGHETDNTDFWDELHDDLKAKVEEISVLLHPELSEKKRDE